MNDVNVSGLTRMPTKLGTLYAVFEEAYGRCIANGGSREAAMRSGVEAIDRFVSAPIVAAAHEVLAADDLYDLFEETQGNCLAIGCDKDFADRAGVGVLAQRFAGLAELAAAARAFVPTCEETHTPDEGSEPVTCGKRATHIDRLNGHDLGYLCDEHAELSLASAKKAASKGHTRAVEADAPRALEPDARVNRLAEALAEVPR